MLLQRTRRKTDPPQGEFITGEQLAEV